MSGAVLADPKAPTSTEAADRQFLANLERTDATPRPVTPPVEVEKPVKPTVVQFAAPAFRPAAPAKKSPARTSENSVVAPISSAPAKISPARTSDLSDAAPVKKSPVRNAQSRREEPVATTDPVEIRKAIPVTTVTTTVTKSSRRDHDDDRDDDDDNGNGFFHRLFRGEKIFR